METQINIYGSIASLLMLGLIALCTISLLIKTTSALLKILSYPTYLALYSGELLFRTRSLDLNKRYFLNLNLPKEASKRFLMNFIASTITFFIGIRISLLLINGGKAFINSIQDGTLIPIPIAVYILVAILIIYIISWHTEIDSRKAYDKIESLTIPSLFSKLFKD